VKKKLTAEKQQNYNRLCDTILTLILEIDYLKKDPETTDEHLAETYTELGIVLQKCSDFVQREVYQQEIGHDA